MTAMSATTSATITIVLNAINVPRLERFGSIQNEKAARLFRTAFRFIG
jgi:hypothetical protein